MSLQSDMSTSLEEWMQEQRDTLIDWMFGMLQSFSHDIMAELCELHPPFKDLPAGGEIASDVVFAALTSLMDDDGGAAVNVLLALADAVDCQYVKEQAAQMRAAEVSA